MEVTKVMKQLKWRKVTFLIAILLIAIVVVTPQSAYAAFDTKAESAIIVDVNSGKILYEKKADEALPPASMTKMMTEYIVLEKINNGELSWDQTTEISDYAFDISADTRFSGIGLRKDVQYTVKDLYDAMAINSDNATTIALAEMISGTEGEFVKLMNKKGEEMGLPHFKFVNSTGLDNETLNGQHPEGTNAEDTNLLSAKSAALLGYRLVVDYPEVLEVSSIPEKKFEDFDIRNYNWMLKHDASYLKPYYYEGVDGLKTGNTTLAGYTFTATAEKNGRRLITVVMKTSSEDERFRETAKLLDYGFDNFSKQTLFAANEVLEGNETLPVTKGKAENVAIAMDGPIELTIENGQEESYGISFAIDESKLDEDGNLVAPIKKGDKVGTATVQFNDEPLTKENYLHDVNETITVDVVATESVEKKSWFSLIFQSIGDFFKNLF